MNTATISAKCRCRNCDDNIEFDPCAAGQTATCPHCGMDTMLFVPGAPIANAPPPLPKNRRWLLIAVAAVVGLGLLIWFVRLLVRSEAAQQAALALGGGVLGLAFLALAATVVILWILFPVFMYFGLGRIEARLHQIERNTHH